MPVVDSTVRLLSRRGNDLTYLCPSIEQLHALAFGPAVFDGEIVAFRDGVQSFEGLQSAMRRRSSEAVAFLVFDVLWLRGISLVDRPYAERRAVLEELKFPDGISVTPWFDDGEALFAATRDNGYEGVVAKKLRSRYRAGLRTRDWIKTKHWQEAEFVIGGWAPPRPEHGWGLLIGDVGVDGRLHYCGRVEFGITSPVREELENRLQPRQSSPFVEIVHEPGAQFVKPNQTAEIRFLERTPGDRLRHATFRQFGGGVGVALNRRRRRRAGAEDVQKMDQVVRGVSLTPKQVLGAPRYGHRNALTLVRTASVITARLWTHTKSTTSSTWHAGDRRRSLRG